MTYDARNSTNVDYNVLNLPRNIPGKNLTYVYDASGSKLQRTLSGVTTDYVDGMQYDGGTLTFIQTEEGRIMNLTGTPNYEYSLEDHLGNARVTFDSSTGAVAKQTDEYYPFGLVASQTGTIFPENKYLYNGKELQDALGQYDYGARFYDPVIGRWTSVDPLAENHHDLTPYNYVLNNPLLYTDEFGLDTTKSITLNEVLIRSAPKRSPVVGFWDNVDYYMHDKVYDGYYYDKQGNATGRAPTMLTVPDLSPRNVLGKVKTASSWLSSLKKLFTVSKYTFKVLDKEGKLIIYSTKIGDEVIKFGGEFEKVDGVLTIKGFDVDGNLVNKLGVKGIRDILNAFGKEQGVSKIIVEGAKRTTGANPGKMPVMKFDIQ